MKKAFFVLPFVFLIILSSVVSAGYYEFQPDGATGYDNFISAGSELEEGRNYGGHYVMYVGSYADLTHHGLMDFSYLCDSIPEDEVITDVKLQLRSTVDVIGSPDLRIYPLKTGWEEGTGAHAPNNDYSNWLKPTSSAPNWNGASDSIDYDGDWNLVVGQPGWKSDDYNNVTLDPSYFNEWCNGDLGVWDKGFIMILNEDAPGNLIGFWSSDHDTSNYRPKLYVFTKKADSDGDTVPDSEDICLETVLPEIPLKGLKEGRYADVDGDGIFETSRRSKIIDSKYSLKDTSGCSCEQVLDIKPGADKNEVQFGCEKDTLRFFMVVVEWAKNFFK